MDRVFFSELKEFVLDVYSVNASFLGVYYVERDKQIYAGTLRDDPFGVHIFTKIKTRFSVNQIIVSEGLEMAYSSGIMFDDDDYRAWIRDKKIRKLLE